MKADELMVGDWVLYHNDGCIDAENDVAPYDENIQIRMSDFERDECFWADLDPIPLTSEILEKNGFKKYSDTLYALVDHFTVEIRLWNDILIRIGKRHDSTFQVGYNWFVNGLVISDVHQLQHALRLCGIDKEITL